VISALIMGSPVRRLLNPITRCWANPHNGYAGTDDGPGTGQKLDADRLTLMSGCLPGAQQCVSMRVVRQCRSQFCAARRIAVGASGWPMISGRANKTLPFHVLSSLMFRNLGTGTTRAGHRGMGVLLREIHAMGTMLAELEQ
jgi:hypothetical protein